ncbi:hypothetical protein ACH4VR_40460 [Streptomyces sp. NPDC020883]|uniref:hypothetical protein n=1 Tax=Streptomyces sp. NPDC020883 TaxID=3365099 RepID=UPI0037A85F5F
MRLIGNVEKHLPAERVRDIVLTVVRARAGRRSLAQALHDDRSLLLTGQPPAPYCVAKLLMALHEAGAQNVALPRCGECGRACGYVGSSKGGHWGCSRCFDKPAVCAGCHEERRVVSRDRHGEPRCTNCPDTEGDPLQELTELVTGLDPALNDDVVLAALGRATVRPAGQRRLAWAVVARPELLTGAGYEAPTPAALRFVDEPRQGRGDQGRPTGLPALPRSEGAVQAAGRQEDLPGLLRPPLSRPLLRLRRRARTRHTRRRGSTAVSELHDQTAREPGGVRRLRPTQARREPAA